MVSIKTKAGLAGAKARWVDLGKSMDMTKANKGRVTQSDIANLNAIKVRATIDGLVAAGLSLLKIAAQLNDMGVTTPRKAQWTAQSVKNALARG